MSRPNFQIGEREVGEGVPVFIVAELSANHNQKIDRAIATIRAAKRAGADAIKLQTYTADSLTIDCENEYFKIAKDTLWDGGYLYPLFEKASTPYAWHAELKRVADEEGLIFFSTPFDEEGVDFLVDLDVPAFKIASAEINHLPLIEYAAKKQLPMIFSSGMASLEDMEAAIALCRSLGNEKLALLKCTSIYPTPFNEVNLKALPALQSVFQTVVGLSDHTPGSIVPVASVAMGATIIEKHITLDGEDDGPDTAFSMLPEAFAEMVDAVRKTEQALGEGGFAMSEAVAQQREFARSIFVVQDVKAGEAFTEDNIRIIRPGSGLHPKHYQSLLGKVASRDLKRGTPLSLDQL